MALKVFFSFHYENDVWRANIVRNSWAASPGTEITCFDDAADFEEVKKGGDTVIKQWIDRQLEGTSVTVVLIGRDASNQDYIKYVIQKSYQRGNGLLGIYIHQIKDKNGNTSGPGSNTFDEIGKDANRDPVFFSISYPCYDWVDDGGCNNLGCWIETAAEKADKQLHVQFF